MGDEREETESQRERWREGDAAKWKNWDWTDFNREQSRPAVFLGHGRPFGFSLGTEVSGCCLTIVQGSPRTGTPNLSLRLKKSAGALCTGGVPAGLQPQEPNQECVKDGRSQAQTHTASFGHTP